MYGRVYAPGMLSSSPRVALDLRTPARLLFMGDEPKHLFSTPWQAFLPETLKNVPCSRSELLINYREESINSGIDRCCRLEMLQQADSQPAQFRV